MPTEQHILNADDVQQKRALLTHIGALRGRWRVELTKFRPRRTDRQNAFYHPCICVPFAQWLAEQDFDVARPKDAHDILRRRFLTVDVVNKATGEVLGERVRSTTELDIGEFSEYIERCRAFLSSYCGIVTPEANPNWKAA